MAGSASCWLGHADKGVSKIVTCLAWCRQVPWLGRLRAG